MWLAHKYRLGCGCGCFAACGHEQPFHFLFFLPLLSLGWFFLGHAHYFIGAVLLYLSIGMVSVPVLLGLPLNVWLGFVLLVQVVFQVLTGKGLLKVNFRYHRANGVLILVMALLHAVMGIGITFFGWSVG